MILDKILKKIKNYIIKKRIEYQKINFLLKCLWPYKNTMHNLFLSIKTNSIKDFVKDIYFPLYLWVISTVNQKKLHLLNIH